MSTLTSSQLQQILDVNAKAVEIYLEVNSQYDAMIKLLEDLKHESKDDNKEKTEKLSDIIKRLEEKLIAEQCKIHEKNLEVLKTTNALEKAVGNQNKILVGAFVVVILAVIGKVFGLPIP